MKDGKLELVGVVHILVIFYQQVFIFHNKFYFYKKIEDPGCWSSYDMKKFGMKFEEIEPAIRPGLEIIVNFLKKKDMK